MKRSLLLLLTLPSCLLADRLVTPPSLFHDPKFAREFVGSYGILSDVEPRVSSDEQAFLETVRQLFEQSKFQEAEASVLQFIQDTEHPKDRKKEPAEVSPAMYFVLGNLEFQAGRTEQARKRFLQAIDEFPRFRRAYTNLGYLHISKNEPKLALPRFQRAVELGESSSRVYGLIGYCHLDAKNPLAAENAYRLAYLLDPSARDWKLGLAQSLLLEEKYPEAASMIGTLIEENPNDKQLWLQQANAFLAMERKEDAIVNLEILRRKGIADTGNLDLLGNLHMDAGQPQLALISYQEAIRKSDRPDVDRTLKSVRILTDHGFPEDAGKLLDTLRTAGKRVKFTTADETRMRLAEVRVARALEKPEKVGTLLEELAADDPANSEVLLELARHKDLQAKETDNGAPRAKLVQEARTNYQLALRDEKVAYEANLGLGQL
ncbi:MAG: tetratricopeptide repeat protein, partial [Verrucomicrobiae bacterium]|nr:tetratricopeptide repeat protein [Verrucomicrobiae bacterium]